MTSMRLSADASGEASPDGFDLGSSWFWPDIQWRNHITLAGSETSRSEPGYLAGAVEAAKRAVREIVGRPKGDRNQALGALSAKS
jgi:hypothetical protein